MLIILCITDSCDYTVCNDSSLWGPRGIARSLLVLTQVVEMLPPE